MVKFVCRYIFHSLLKHILFYLSICRIPVNLNGFFSMHAERFNDFDGKKFLKKKDTMDDMMDVHAGNKV